jgi:RNA polymerase sigma-54 factor
MLLFLQMFDLKQEKTLNIKQTSRLMLTTVMQHALYVLQLPIVELAEWVTQQVEQNPILESEEEKRFNDHEEYEESDFAFENRPEYQIRSPERLFEYLMQQAHEAFTVEKDRLIAEWIIGHLDERGFLSEPEDDLLSHFDPRDFQRVLNIIRSFDPPGIAATDLQTSLLTQLKQKQKHGSLAWLMCESYFDDFIHYRLSVLKKKLKCDEKELDLAFTEISYLDFHPGYRFREASTPAIIPDVILRKEEDKWMIEINENFLPKFHFSSPAISEEKDKAFFHHFYSLGNGLIQSLQRRGDTLKALTHFLAQKHRDFFEGETSHLPPLTMQEAADHLQVHESTIARAVADKYLSCPQGVFRLRYFFNRATETTTAQSCSNQALQTILIKLIGEEDKSHPFSDDSLSLKIQSLGHNCSRRTVTKYRKSLRIAPSAKRKKHRSRH